MNNLKNQVIDQIFKLLAPLRSIYKEEVDKVTNDLLNNDTKSFEEFINKYYKDVDNSLEFFNLIKTLVDNNLIASSFLEDVKVQSVNNSVIKQVSIRPLNVKTATFEKIKKADLGKLDKTLFPIISLNKIKEDEVKENETIINNDIPTITPVEIEPDYNTKPDIKLPFDETDNEIPDFNTYNQVETGTDNTNIDFTIPDIAPITEIPPIQIPTQEVITKEDIFKSIENNDVDEEKEDPNIKNTTQLGQILQFPLKDNSQVVEPEGANIEVNTLENKEDTALPNIPTPSFDTSQITIKPEIFQIFISSFNSRLNTS